MPGMIARFRPGPPSSTPPAANWWTRMRLLRRIEQGDLYAVLDVTTPWSLPADSGFYVEPERAADPARGGFAGQRTRAHGRQHRRGSPPAFPRGTAAVPAARRGPGLHRLRKPDRPAAARRLHLRPPNDPSPTDRPNNNRTQPSHRMRSKGRSMTNPHLSRRTVLQAGGTVGLAAALGLAAGGAANASWLPAGRPAEADPEILDLGPAVVQFGLMSSILVGDVVYIGSRNVEPVRIVAYHVPTGKVVGQTELATGHSIQTLAADSAGRYLYAGVLQKSTGPQPNLYRWDLASLSAPATPIGRIGDRDVRDLSVAPDGRLYAVGGGSPTAPALWEYNPATGLVANLGIPDAGCHPGAGRRRHGRDRLLRGRQHPGWRRQRRARLPARLRPGEPHLHSRSPRRDAGGSQHQGPGHPRGQAPGQLRGLDRAVEGRPHGRWTTPLPMRVATSIGKTAKNFAAIGEQVYFANESGLCAYSVASNSISQVDARRTGAGRNLGRGRPERQGPGHLRLRLHRRDRSRHGELGGHRPRRGRRGPPPRRRPWAWPPAPDSSTSAATA